MRLLDRLILRELLRRGLLTTGVLVTVIAFGAAIKPLSDDDLFGAGQIALYIALAMVPMLQFAIPFAAGFAGTLSPSCRQSRSTRLWFTRHPSCLSSAVTRR